MIYYVYMKEKLWTIARAISLFTIGMGFLFYAAYSQETAMLIIGGIMTTYAGYFYHENESSTHSN